MTMRFVLYAIGRGEGRESSVSSCNAWSVVSRHIVIVSCLTLVNECVTVGGGGPALRM